MPRKKKHDTALTIVIISVLGGIAAAYFGGPLADTQWKERPLADISFGMKEGFPKDTLHKQNNQYVIPIILDNRGKSDAKTILLGYGTNAKIRISEIGNFDYQYTLPFTIRATTDSSDYPIYVIPDENEDFFTVQISTQTPQQNPLFQEINLFRPTILTYEKTDDGYRLKDQQ